MKKVFAVMGFLVFASSQTVFAATEGQLTEGVSNRMGKRAGAYVGILGDPFPTILGINLGYNVADFMRVSAGMGQISATTSFGSNTSTSSATTIGATVRGFMPGWNLSPTVGLGVAYVSVSSDGLVSVQNFTESGAHVYASFGVDYQAAAGFNVGAGYNVSFRSGTGGAPYINLGWFVDWI